MKQLICFDVDGTLLTKEMENEGQYVKGIIPTSLLLNYGKKIMDSASINPVRGSDVQTAKPQASSGKSVSAKPAVDGESTPKDTVTLSPAGKNALESGTPVAAQDSPRQPPPANTATDVDRPESGSGDPNADNSRKFSVTDSNDVVLKIVDNKTREVVKQIPSEEELQLKTAIRDGVENISSENNRTEELI